MSTEPAAVRKFYDETELWALLGSKNLKSADLACAVLIDLVRKGTLEDSDPTTRLNNALLARGENVTARMLCGFAGLIGNRPRPAGGPTLLHPALARLIQVKRAEEAQTGLAASSLVAKEPPPKTPLKKERAKPKAAAVKIKGFGQLAGALNAASV